LRTTAIFPTELDQAVENFGITPIKTPVRAPQANAFCERVIGTICRECLDFMIPVNERHLRTILREWVSHYNKGRPSLQLTAGNSRPENGTTSHDTSPSF
jgi:putative transposase